MVGIAGVCFDRSIRSGATTPPPSGWRCIIQAGRSDVMGMSRKDYQNVADIISAALAGREFYPDRLVNDLCAMFAADNERFDADRFRAACGLPVVSGVI